jgi:hypothetical protein
MNRRAIALASALCLASPLATGRAHAQAPASTDAVRAEAGERFDRGLKLFNAGDNAGALVEFRRAYELVENVVVLYNIGLVYAQMGRAVEATDALDRVLARPGSLSPERLALARKTRDEQASRIVEIAVKANVDGARIEVDGIEVGQTPLAAPLRVTSGAHVIGAVAPGYSPQRKEIAIAGGEKQSLSFELVVMQGRLAHLTIKTHLPGADLFSDEQRIGTSPLSASVTLSPGAHHIEARRAGYVTATEDLSLGDGATGEVTLEPTEDPSALVAGGSLALDLSETAAVVTVDGRPRGVYTAPLRLPEGPHHLVVERGDFLPFERDVTVSSGRTTTVRIVLEPTPEYRTRYSSSAQAQRTWGWIGLVGGAVLIGGGVGLVLYDAKQRSDGESTQNAIDALSVRNGLQLCDPGQDTSTAAYKTNCTDPRNAAAAKIADANTRDYIGFSALGVGAAGAVLGVVLLATAGDPHKYDVERPRGDLGFDVVPSVGAARGGGTLGVAGTF